MIGAGGAVAVRQVRVGTVWNGMTQVVSGLKPDERVVTAGLDHLREGAKVRVVRPASAPASGASPTASAPHAAPSAPGGAARRAAWESRGGPAGGKPAPAARR